MTERPRREYHHGQSPAAWAGVILSGIGFLIGTVAFMMGPNMTLIWIAAAFIALGVIAAGVLRGMGSGQG